MHRILSLIVAVMVCLAASAQGTYVPLGSDAYYQIERLDIKYSRILPGLRTSDKSYHRGDVAKFAETLQLSNLRFSKVQQYNLKWLADDNAEWLDSLSSVTRKPLGKVFYREPASFLHYSSKKKGLFDIRLNPIFDLRVGLESFDKRFVFSSARGVEVRGNIKKVFSFYFNVFGNATRPLGYVANKARDPQYPYVPGQAYWKNYESKLFKFKDGQDYFDARGYVNVNVLKYLNISFGRDKFFIGDGQRSLFLSDYSSPYLFLKFDLQFWRIRYQSILAELHEQYKRGSDQLLSRKYMAVHHLTVQPWHGFTFGFFEGVVLKRSNHFELQYLNPIIFYRSVEHAIGSPDNVLLGADFKLNLINHLSIYGQLLLDEFNFKYFFKGNGWWANKWGIQAGVKYIDIAPNLDAQIEFNYVRPFTYTHESDINYTNYNQPLAHPLGANFYEVILQMHYQPIPQLALNAKLIAARVGDDTLDVNGNFTNLGGNILMSSGGGTDVTQQFGNKVGQGAKGTITYFQLTASYQPWHNIYVDAEVLYRNKSSVKTANNTSNLYLYNQSTFAFLVGLRMNIGLKRNEF